MMSVLLRDRGADFGVSGVETSDIVILFILLISPICRIFCNRELEKRYKDVL
jgi:hypothetical protein